MAWSTSELADIAGTTVNTIRHYHRLGLLEEPERRYNGYKQYGVRHLVRLLRIRRLAELGVPLSSVGAVDSDDEGLSDTLRALDAELATRIEHLQQARADIAAVLRDDAPADAPAGFASVASHLSDADSAIVHISTKLYDQSAMSDLRRMVQTDAETGAIGREFSALAADADEATRQDLAARFAPTLARNLTEYPWLSEPRTRLSTSERVAQQTFVEALVELYNPAQLDVFARAGVLAQEQLQQAGRTGSDSAESSFDNAESSD